VIVGAREALKFEVCGSGRITDVPVLIVLTAGNKVEYNVPHADKCVAMCHC
jgi:hypothetical protein